MVTANVCVARPQPDSCVAQLARVALISRRADDGRVKPIAVQTVAVLMTDLVGSTAIADRLGPAAAETLRLEHFGLLRGGLERTGGREVKNLGDGLMVVLQSASQALTCAVDMQQAIEARNRHSEERLEVRIGVSLGEATVEDEDYFGEPVIEASRLCAQADGGQIAVSALVRQLGGAREGHTFTSLGDLKLKGMSEPVQAFEVHWEPVLSSAIALPRAAARAASDGLCGAGGRAQAAAGAVGAGLRGNAACRADQRGGRRG